MKKIMLIFIFQLIFFNYLSDNSFADDPIFDTSDEAIERRARWRSLFEECGNTVNPSGKIFQIFKIGSDYTDLQRDDTLKELDGKMVTWRYPVYEVKKDGNDKYLIFCSPSNAVDCIIKVTATNDQERKLIHSLKTGSMITFKGILTGKTSPIGRALMIDPAIILTTKDDPACQ